MKPSASVPPLSADDNKKRRGRLARRTRQGYALALGEAAYNETWKPVMAQNSMNSDSRVDSERAAATSGWIPSAPRKYYEPHLSGEALRESLEKGFSFRGNFRVNAYNRLEGYCTVDGLPIDVLLNGTVAQNRAVDGDVVAVMLDPVPSWTKLKGAALYLNDSSPNRVQERGDVASDTVPDASGEVNEWPPAENKTVIHEVIHTSETNRTIIDDRPGSSFSSGFDSSNDSSKKSKSELALDRWSALMNSSPLKRPTGKVVAIIEQSHHRQAVGFLLFRQSQSILEVCEKQAFGVILKKNHYCHTHCGRDYAIFRPNNPRLPDMLISVANLPGNIKERLARNDPTVAMDLVAACIASWTEDIALPWAHVIEILGRGGELETQISAIFFENRICGSDFSPESLSCLPDIPWKIPAVELERRRDLRNLCIFTIDPSSAVDLDDALSVEQISDDVCRVGVHIADVSYFVCPGSALDQEARSRSTSVYVLRHKVNMLPPQFADEFCSLNPGVDRLAFSVMWDISDTRGIIDQWIGHSVIRSCCKLSYKQVQCMIDGASITDLNRQHASASFEVDSGVVSEDVLDSVKLLHKISKKLKENRFRDGALKLDSAKLEFFFDEHGTPYDGAIMEQEESNSLVEEFMLLANRTVAGVISKTFRERSLLRRHPEPNLRKLKEVKEFCKKHGFELETFSSSQMYSSLCKIKEELKDDPVLFDILVFQASKPMQLAMYFCTGDLLDREDEWAHYALAFPFYTHFTSPMRRYPDIVVHRILCAVLKAEKIVQRMLTSEEHVDRFFTGISFNIKAVECQPGRDALAAAAIECKLPGPEDLSEIAAYCNKREQASKNAEEYGKKAYLWALLRIKESMLCEARVIALGPRFMSIYIHKLAIDRRIHFSEVEGLAVEWLENTSTLVMDLLGGKRLQKKRYADNSCPLNYVACVMNPANLNDEDNDNAALEEDHAADLTLADTACNRGILPASFPLTLRVLSTVPVILHAVGGDDGPVDVGVRLYMSSYFVQLDL